MEFIFIPIKCSSLKVEKHTIFFKGTDKAVIYLCIYSWSQNSVLVEWIIIVINSVLFYYIFIVNTFMQLYIIIQLYNSK